MAPAPEGDERGSVATAREGTVDPDRADETAERPAAMADRDETDREPTDERPAAAADGETPGEDAG